MREILIVGNEYKIGETLTWNLPGGIVEPGEDLCSAVGRELFEETGIEAVRMGCLAWIIQIYRKPEQPSILGFIFEVADWRGNVTLENEVEEGAVRRAEFVTYGEACERLIPAAATALRNWLEEKQSAPRIYIVKSVMDTPGESRVGRKTSGNDNQGTATQPRVEHDPPVVGGKRRVLR